MRRSLRWGRGLTTSSVLALALVIGVPEAAAEEVASGRDAVLQVTEEYRQVVAAYQPGAAYEQVLEQLASQLEALSPEEIATYDQFFGSLAARAREQLNLLTFVLRYRDAALREQAAIRQPMMGTTEFPDADFSEVQIEETIDIALEELPKFTDLWKWILSGQILDIPDIPLLPDDAVPIYCKGDTFPQDGLPNREPPLVRMAYQVALQILDLRWRIADRICNQDLGLVAVVVGGGGVSGNLSFACIIEDIFIWTLQSLYDNLMICEAYYDGVEIETSYLRLGHLHGDLESHDSNLSRYNGQIQDILADIQATQSVHGGLLAAIQATQGEHGILLQTLLANQEVIIELLNTPQGRRGGWND